MHKIFIDGEAGTTGLGIRERLKGVKDLKVLSIAPEQRKDPKARQGLMADADVVVLCLPDDAAREAVALADGLGPKRPRILDASTAHRVAEGWVYGFPELDETQAAKIAKAERVANVGCYAVGAISLLHPLVKAGLIPRDFPVAIGGVSGYSGGGRTMIEAHEAGSAPAFEIYGLGLDHKHIPEIARYSGLARRPIFLPSVGNFRQGMIVSVPLTLAELPGSVTVEALEAAYARHYEGSKYVVVKTDRPKRLDALGLNGTDTLEIRVAADKAGEQAILLARLDNLGKGASGSAVQNLKLMLGLN